MYIERPFYLQKLIDRRENGSIKVITGLRRCGKSHLLFEQYYRCLLADGVPKDRIVKIALDDEENAALRDPLALSAHVRSLITDKTSMHYIMLDEVQFAISEAERKSPDVPIRLYGVLNGLLRLRNVDVYVTGSNSRFLSSDVRTEFRGRGDEVRVRPLSFSEYAPAHGGAPEDAWFDYMTYGGMPLVLSRTGDEAKMSYLDSLFREVYFTDIEERHGLRNNEALSNLTDVLASATGSLTNPRNIANTFRSTGRGSISETTVRSYINALKDAFLIEEAQRFDVKGRKYIGSPFKYYFADIGLRNARLRFRQVEENHVMENAVYNELLCRGFAVDVGIVRHEERDGRGKRVLKHLEIDFVASKGSMRYYIQSAFELGSAGKLAQEQKSLLNTRDSFKKIIVTRGRVRPWRTEEGVLVIGLLDFLTNPAALDG